MSKKNTPALVLWAQNLEHPGPICWARSAEHCAVLQTAAGMPAVSFREHYPSAADEEDLRIFLETHMPAWPVILTFSEEHAEEAARLKALFEDLGILYTEPEPLRKRTPDEIPPDELRAILEEATEEARALDQERGEQYREAMSAAGAIDDFISNIHDPDNAEAIKTGFPKLDSVLDGGLFAGLYIIGAQTGHGKTTFALQIADHIARSGRDVLIFSLEMSRDELIAKSVSRLAYEDLQRSEHPAPEAVAVTARGILAGGRYDSYSEARRGQIRASIEQYRDIAKHIYIFAALGNIAAEEIRRTVERHILKTHSRPVVIVDYLQILKPKDRKATDKQNTDWAVMDLKSLSVDTKAPVLAISSFNRTSYGKGAETSSFKESGAIEYSADCLIAIDPTEGAAIDSTGRTRRATVKILKNRFAPAGCGIDYTFMPAFNIFLEQGSPAPWDNSTAASEEPDEEQQQISWK